MSRYKTHIEYTDNYGRVKRAEVLSEFHDEDGRRFFVIRRLVGNYDTDPPYRVIEKTDEVTVFTTRNRV